MSVSTSVAGGAMDLRSMCLAASYWGGWIWVNMGPAIGVRPGVYAPLGLWCQQLEQVGVSVPATGVGEGLGISHWTGTVGHRAHLCPGCRLLGRPGWVKWVRVTTSAAEVGMAGHRAHVSRCQLLGGLECLYFTLTCCACVSNLLANFELD